MRWSAVNPALNFTDVSESGTLTGITGINQGLGLDIQPYVVLRAKHDWQRGERRRRHFRHRWRQRLLQDHAGADRHVDLQPGFLRRAARRARSQHHALLAVRAGDARLLPAGRRRLSNSAAAASCALPGPQRNNARPFFSRNLGLVQGTPVSLIGGGKLSGEYGGFDIGALSVLTDDTSTSEGQVLSVARLTHPVLSQSHVGMIVTNGDPTGRTRNTVAGADFQYRNSDFLGGETVVTDLYYERSFSSARGDDDAFGAVLNLPNEPWGWDFAFKQVGSNFRPALGFANRRVRSRSTTAPSDISRGFAVAGDFYARPNTDPRRVWDGPQQSAAGLPGPHRSADTSLPRMTISNPSLLSHERLTEPFLSHRGPGSCQGEYNWTNFAWHMSTAQSRPNTGPFRLHPLQPL